jgi:glycerol-3-phosphate dehydrogenase subunit C
MMEKVLGIHRDKQLPDFARTTFEAWAAANGKITQAPKPGGPRGGALPDLLRAEQRAPDRPRHPRGDGEEPGEVACVKGLGCCGMPAWEHGDLDGLRAQAKANLDLLMPWVEAGAKVMAINPTCSMMMRREYPSSRGEDRERAEKLAAAVRDPSEHLWSIRSGAPLQHRL